MKTSKPLIILGDFDSLAYTAGRCETEEDMQTTINNKISTMIKRCGTNKVIGWVEVIHNKQNFRKHVATTRVYKGKRKKEKPQFLNEAKRYLVDMGWARWCNFIESEDMMLIKALEYGLDHCIKAFIDKDCRQQAGRCYDYKHDRLYTITEAQAWYNLWHQFLTGDVSTDNIVGIWRFGDDKASALLDQYDPSDYPLAVAKEYKARGYSYDYMLEQCRLLYLLRTAGDVFHYPMERKDYELI